MYQRVVIPTDGSDCSINAVQAGVEFARTLGVGVTFVHIAEQPHMPISNPNWDDSTAHLRDQLAREGNDILEVANRIATEVGVETHTMLQSGERPHDIIIEMSKPGDLIVMGSHGRTGVERIIFGSTTERVLQRANVPVLVIPCRV